MLLEIAALGTPVQAFFDMLTASIVQRTQQHSMCLNWLGRRSFVTFDKP